MLLQAMLRCWATRARGSHLTGYKSSNLLLACLQPIGRLRFLAAQACGVLHVIKPAKRVALLAPGLRCYLRSREGNACCAGHRVLTLNMDVPEPWLVEPVKADYDLDNLRLQVLCVRV